MTDKLPTDPQLAATEPWSLSGVGLAHEHIRALVDGMSQFQEHMRPFVDSARLIQKRMQPFNEFAIRIAEQAKELTKGLMPFVEQIEKTVEAVRKGFETRLEYYPNLLAQVTPLAHLGWFVSEYFGFGELDRLAVLAKSGTIEDLGKNLAELYESSLDEHVKSIIRDYPDRELELQQAGSAHARGDYALSVMAFFSQADGICAEATQRYFFQGDGHEHISALARDKIAEIKRDSTTHSYNDFLDLMVELMWTAMIHKLPIGYNRNQRLRQNYVGLNRHTILHGISKGVEYGTKENSLKAFSLLSYMASLAKAHVLDAE